MSTLQRSPVRALFVALAVIAGLLLVPTEANAQGADLQVETVATGLEAPWGLAFLPDGNALVTERDTGRLLEVAPSGQVTEVATIDDVEAPLPGIREGGLMGVTLSPDFADDQLVYLYYTATSENRIVRATYGAGQLGEREVVLDGIPNGQFHNGGRIAFGPDGMLYASTGEANMSELAQDQSSLAGKVLRMTRDGEPAPGNPFDSHVWSYGHRNIQGFGWDSDGRMYATEFGQNARDEINLIEPGSNYGWPVVEGEGGAPEFTDPLLTWTTAEASPSGTAIHDGSMWVAALRGARLWEVPLTGDGGVGTPAAHLVGEYGRLRAVEVAPDGSLWVLTSNRDGRGSPGPEDDRILAVTPGGGDPDPGPGECVTATNSVHRDEGRAEGLFVLSAVGSGDSLGLWTGTTSLREASPGVWERVDAC